MKKPTNRATTPRITILGGGTGSSVVLKGLVRYPVRLTGITTVADSGGSSNTLRKEYGVLPFGDAASQLTALFPTENENDNLLADLFLVRFDKGSIGGHKLGNLILLGLTYVAKQQLKEGLSPGLASAKAIDLASRIFRVNGQVLPVSVDDVQLIATYKDTKKVVGEHLIDDPKKHPKGRKPAHYHLEPPASLYDPARKALVESDAIILGPGDVGTSTIANLVVDGVKDTIGRSHALLVHVVNLMSKNGQTSNSAREQVEEVARYSGRYPDVILINSAPIPNDVIRLYAEEGELPVEDDLGDIFPCRVIREDLITTNVIRKVKGDILARSVFQHDPDKLGKLIYDLLQ